MNTTIWIIQCLLSAFFLVPAFVKLFSSKEKLIELKILEPNGQLQKVKLIGALELLGSIGIVIPWYTGIQPILTPIAATGFALIMTGAFVVHFSKKEFRKLPIIVVVFIFSAFVAYNRF